MKTLILTLSLLLITTNSYSYELTEYTCNNVYDKVNCNESCKTIKDLKFFNVFGPNEYHKNAEFFESSMNYLPESKPRKESPNP